MLAKLMFPAHPSACLVLNNFLYPPQLRTLARISAEQIQCHIDSLSPHKAPGPDRIPNSVLKFCAGIITPHLVPIYRAILHLKVYPTQWRESTTCVLRKPGKCYESSLSHPAELSHALTTTTGRAENSFLSISLYPLSYPLTLIPKSPTIIKYPERGPPPCSDPRTAKASRHPQLG